MPNDVLVKAPAHYKAQHFKAIGVMGDKFVYCPVGNICSWLEGDYDNEWCEFCHKYFIELREVQK